MWGMFPRRILPAFSYTALPLGAEIAGLTGLAGLCIVSR